MAIDPVGFKPDQPMTFNRYSYANNNPYKYIDPDGRNATTAFGGVLYESYQAVQGNGFNGERVMGALADGYNGSASDVMAALGQDVMNFVPAGAAIKVLRVVVKGLKGAKAASVVAPNAKQAANINRFQKKIPSNAKNSVELSKLPNGGVAAKATSPGKVPGSKAVYEKQIDASGKTVKYTKTTQDPKGNIVHVKDKLN